MARPIKRWPAAIGVVMMATGMAQAQPCQPSIKQSLVYVETSVEDGTTGAITRHRGTGFLVRRSGYFLTNAHVVPRPLGATVEIHGILGAKQGVKYTVSEVKRDTDHDLLLLKFDSQLPDLHSLRLSTGSVQEGVKICSVSFNMVSPTAVFVEGIVSSLGGGEGNKRWTVRMPSVAGDSGAPVLGPTGDVVAIKVEGVQNGNGLNYVIPVQYAIPLDQYAGPKGTEKVGEWGAIVTCPAGGTSEEHSKSVNVSFVLPPGAKSVQWHAATQLESENREWNPERFCVVGNDCAWSRFAGPVDQVRSDGFRVLGVTLKCWSHNQNRLGRIFAEFELER
jgi:hypothetical protein